MGYFAYCHFTDSHSADWLSDECHSKYHSLIVILSTDILQSDSPLCVIQMNVVAPFQVVLHKNWQKLSIYQNKNQDNLKFLKASLKEVKTEFQQ